LHAPEENDEGHTDERERPSCHELPPGDGRTSRFERVFDIDSPPGNCHDNETEIAGEDCMSKPVRFPILFDDWYRAVSIAVFLRPSSAYVTVDGDDVDVRMGWAFRSRFPRAAVASAAETHRSVLSRGVHGFAGRWLVNGSGQGLLAIELAPRQRAYVMGFPVRLRTLIVSVADPAALAVALGYSPRS
jgi:hypothetical protein